VKDNHREPSLQGLLMLWRGMLPAVYRHAIYTGIRMSAYEEIRDSLQKENKVREENLCPASHQLCLKLFSNGAT